MNIIINCVYDEKLNVSSANEELEIVVSDKETLPSIKAGKVSAMLIPVEYSSVLYDESSMFEDGFCSDKCDNMTVREFREHYKKHFDKVEFKYFGNNIPERITMRNPDWDVSEIPEFFKLTWKLYE